MIEGKKIGLIKGYLMSTKIMFNKVLVLVDIAHIGMYPN